MEICPASISKISSNCKNNNFFDDTKQRKRRLALSCSKKLSALLYKITSKIKGDSYCLNCLHTFRTENKFNCHKKSGKKILVEL